MTQGETLEELEENIRDACLLINRGKPPALPEDSQSLTVPGVFLSLALKEYSKQHEKLGLSYRHSGSVFGPESSFSRSSRTQSTGPRLKNLPG